MIAARASWLWILWGWALVATGAPPFMGLDEVEPGQRGEWRTVTEGREARSFRLEIIGRVPNYLGPGKDAVLARALDPEHILSGPVAGMSGSPVYVDGRLLGAYAFGYTWPKEQAIIGITPIEHMVGLLRWEETGGSAGGGLKRGTGVWGEGWGRSLPTPLMAGGIGAGAVELMRERYEALGLNPMAGGGGSGAAGDFPLEAGSAMAAILMQGDFTMAATGTVTYRDGDRLVGFGHPFLQWGELAMPFGGAEILTIIRNLQVSFKFSNPGPAVGTLRADRTTGVAGEIGVVPEMTQLRLGLGVAGGDETTFEAEVFRHPQMTPLLVATAVAEALGQAIAAERESLLELEADIALVDGARATVELADSGPGASGRLALGLLDRLGPVLNHREGESALALVDARIRQSSGWREVELESVTLDRERYGAGDTVRARVRGRARDGEKRIWELSASLPELLPRGSRVRAVVADAARRDQLRGGGEPGLWDAEEALRSWEEREPGTVLSLWLVAEGTGLVVDGQELSGLPESVRQRLAAGGLESAPGGRQILAEDTVRAESLFRGHWETELQLETR